MADAAPLPPLLKVLQLGLQGLHLLLGPLQFLLQVLALLRLSRRGLAEDLQLLGHRATLAEESGVLLGDLRLLFQEGVHLLVQEALVALRRRGFSAVSPPPAPPPPLPLGRLRLRQRPLHRDLPPEDLRLVQLVDRSLQALLRPEHDEPVPPRLQGVPEPLDVHAQAFVLLELLQDLLVRDFPREPPHEARDDLDAPLLHRPTTIAVLDHPTHAPACLTFTFERERDPLNEHQTRQARALSKDREPNFREARVKTLGTPKSAPETR
mmetsp:Transcript_14619/g.41757  ORF Transcript_14619/g.41757 Transcript_14619/m.41757 type:complete len:266 (-) Transcript_14619:40-837(-)